MGIRRFLRNVLLAVVPVALVWAFLTPFYNLFLITAGENLLHLLESPDETRLGLDGHYAQIAHMGLGRQVYSFRVTDSHYPVVLASVLFLAVPGVPLRKRFENLGIALVILAFFHLALVVAWVKFAYATQLGPWSLENYGPVAREVYGMTKHLLDLPIKLALPLVLWAFFYLEVLLPRK